MFHSIARRWCRVLAAACLATALAACNESEAPNGDATLRTAETAEHDGAAVTYKPAGALSHRTQHVTVARNANSAPSLPPDVLALGPVYQFAPLGMAGAGIEIRVPFTATGAAQARLWMAIPGEGWAEVANARVEGGVFVARVPQLGHAVVVAPVGDARRKTLQAAQAQEAATGAAVVTLSVDAATQPALPQPDASGVVRVTQPTNLVLRADYALPSGCTRAPRLRAYAVYLPRNAAGGHAVELANLPLPALAGAVSLNQTLANSDNGAWTYTVAVHCSEPGQPTPRYSYRSAGPVLEVDIQATTAPVITQQPQNVAVTEGDVVALGVNASGNALNYQWQRSNDAGLNYANVPGANARTLSFNAALTDDTSLWRVVVSNAGGQTVSTPALLTVAQRVVAPAVTSDPSSQDVTEGQTASFTVLGTGTPAPAVQWQTRAAAQANAEAGWSDIDGAAANTYVVAAASLSQQGRQYRALLRNSGGTAASAAATLTVRAALVAPAIVQGPQSTTVQAGQSGLFSVAVSGSTPMSYQWFKDGQAIAGANASEVLIPAGTADVGSVWQITVQVSNAAGSVGSEAAQMSVVAVPDTGTLVVAGEGAVLQAGADDSGATLVIDANALSANASISLTTEASSVVNLPADVQPLGDVVNIGPAGVDFAVPATLNLPIPVDVPEGKVLGVLEIQSVATANGSGAGSKRQVKGQRTAMQARQPAEAPTPGNLRRLAAQARSGLGMVVLGAGDALTIRCPDAQSVRGGRALVDLAKTGMRFLAAAVPESLCSGGTTSKPRKFVPSTSTAPCANGDFPAQAGELNQLSRHVHCQRDQAELDLGYSPAEGPAKYFGRYLLSWKIGSDGTPKQPSKNYRVKLKLTPVDTAGAQPLTGLTVKPVFECGSSLSQGLCNAQGATRALGSNSEVEINTAVTFSWDGGKDTYKEFTMGQIALRMAFPGEDIDKAGRTVYLSAPPTIRCDNMMADGVTKGCVYAQAPAVLVMSRSDPSVREAALHIDDAQKAGANGALIVDADGSLHATASNALQRTQVTGLKNGANRSFACQYGNSAISLRPQASPSCSSDGSTAACQCDEYPFASTWNGAYSTRGGLPASARYIKHDHNSVAGSWIGRFYKAERVIDYTPDPGIAFTLENESVSIPSRVGGDDFWVYIE